MIFIEIGLYYHLGVKVYRAHIAKYTFSAKYVQYISDFICDTIFCTTMASLTTVPHRWSLAAVIWVKTLLWTFQLVCILICCLVGVFQLPTHYKTKQQLPCCLPWMMQSPVISVSTAYSMGAIGIKTSYCIIVIWTKLYVWVLKTMSYIASFDLPTLV